MSTLDWQVRRVEQTGSTNADLAQAARSGAPEGRVLVAGHQTAGRGRLERGWASPPGTGLTFSVVLRPAPVPTSRWGWLPVLAGLAVTDAVSEETGVVAALKWPNDVLIAERKVCGILSELVPPRAAARADRSDASEGFGKTTESAGETVRSAAVVIGIGLNVASTAEHLPETGTSVSIAAGCPITPEAMLSPVLTALADWYGRWRAADGDADACGARPAYRERSATLGRMVAIRLPNEANTVEGEAVDVDSDGRLVLRTLDGTPRTFGSGDVVHASLR